MPSIRSVACSADLVRLIDQHGTHDITGVAIGGLTIAQAENFVNNTWIPANISGYKAQIHIFSLNPLHATMGTWDLDLTIPANWWLTLDG